MASSSPWRRRLAPLLMALWGLSTAAMAQDKPRAEMLWDTWGFVMFGDPRRLQDRVHDCSAGS